MRAERPISDFESRWHSWLLARNRRGTRTLLLIVLFLYPAFGVLDYVIAPKHWLWLLYSTRVVVTAATLAMFRIIRLPAFERNPNAISSAYMLLCSFGISLMTVLLGGMASPYYAGLTLAIVATGLLFVWPTQVVVVTHSTILASFVAPNLLQPTNNAVAAISNLFFLISTGIIAGTGQIVAYRAQREQVVNQLIIERTKTNLEQAHEQLKQLDRFKSQFFANITHELKTPLAMILAPLELLLDPEHGSASEAQRPALQAMFRSGIKLLKLIADLLDLSKLEESRLRLRVEEHDLVVYLRGLLAQVRPLAQRKAIELHFDSNVETAIAACDLERMERVFINLLSNATKFTQVSGNIWLAVKDTGDRVVISVKDDGVGFPTEMAGRVFERFFQVDMAGTRKYGGTGIGLALAKELVELHGGEIYAESSVGRGATFTVELLKDQEHFAESVIDRRSQARDLPDGKREADRGLNDWTSQLAQREDFRLLEIDEATEQRVVDRDVDEDDRAHTVLVVEDTPEIIRVIHLALHDHFRIFAAGDGKKGLELATRELPNLIISDLMMPEIDGLELTRRLRANPKTRHIPIVMLTARSDLDDRVAGLDTGVNAYLTKPFSPRELLSTVRSLLGTQDTTTDLLLNQKMDSLEVVAAALAHEINNPLNYVKNAMVVVADHAQTLTRLAEAADAQKAADAGARMRKLFDVAESGIKRIAATVELMRRYSREGFSRELQPHDVFAAAKDVVNLILPAMARDIRVETAFEGDGAAECVPEELHQVLAGLVENALQAVGDGAAGLVRVRGWSENGFVMVSIQDNGPGIKPEHRSKVFTPFFTTKGPGGGTGMGLAIARRVVMALGGTISLKSQVGPGSGTEFTVKLPRTQSRDRRREASTAVRIEHSA